MVGEWRRRSLGELCDAGVAELQTGPFGSQLHAHDYVDQGVAVVPTEAIRNRQIDHSVLPKITFTKAKSLDRHRLRPGDILFARRGAQATGHIGYVREPENGFICGTGAIRLRVCEGNREVLPEFLSHVLANPASVEWFKFHAIGATMPNLNEGIIRSFSFSVPSVEEQRVIAHILGTLDDKIELNRWMNETLEAIAQALFKSWFVDFDPVRAKHALSKVEGAEGHDPGLPKPLADLFPDSFEDSELGEIPNGWRIVPLEELAGIQGGKQLPTEECQQSGTYPVFGANGIMGYAERATHEAFVIAFGRVGAYCGSIHWAYRGAWITNNASSVLPDRWPEYVLQAMLNTDFEGMRTGSAQPFIPNSTLAAAQVVCAPDAILDTFCAKVQPLRLKQVALEEECCTLATLRDTLLPKLISGELRVPDAERIVGRYT